MNNAGQATPLTDPVEIADESGFPFQIALEAEVTKRSRDWQFACREKAWRVDKYEGFIDLMFTSGPLVAVVECKRRRDAHPLVFITPAPLNRNRNEVRLRWFKFLSPTVEGRSLSRVAQLPLLPLSHIAEFCQIKGSSSSDRPTLERWAGELIIATDALASQLYYQTQQIDKQERVGALLPIIVTNAPLKIVGVDAIDFDLTSGRIGSSEVQDVDFVRFQKSFVDVSGSLAPVFSNMYDLDSRSVFIVRANKFANFLNELRDATVGVTPPWKLNW